jgi:hypothetical protein
VDIVACALAKVEVGEGDSRSGEHSRVHLQCRKRDLVGRKHSYKERLF